ncbi:hypothetical protein H2199_009053 [Coniosporium tulheliwenetii]|uniref:Uncharacterized protein n=1 Tax=Coniosporium tulheliwenetii TaxID=3383036 RepID=A0ACC2YFX4_9PEZI|nr:hypothetical protein H2199_009053 [Cladosporium sp. JES 115]
MPSSQAGSPRKRRRAENDGIFPNQSVSVTSPTELTERTRIDPPSSSRPSSPTRDLPNQLRIANPAIDCTPPQGVVLPDSATILRKHLVQDFGQRVIPAGLRQRIAVLGPEWTEEIPDFAYDNMDAQTPRTRFALEGGLEVKQAGGDNKEAQAQLSIWLAAGLEHMWRLGNSAKKEPYPIESLQPMVGCTIVGHDWHTHIAFKVTEDQRDKTRVIGPINLLVANTRDYYGIFKLIDLIKRVTKHAEAVYWPWLRDDILKPLVPGLPEKQQDKG